MTSCAISFAEGPIPPSTLAALWRHYERIGAYARAEDILFILLEEQPDNPALISEAKLFYERLPRQSDTALEEGNLPREEVKEGFAEIQKLSSTNRRQLIFDPAKSSRRAAKKPSSVCAKTTYTITPAGGKALGNYLRNMKRLIDYWKLHPAKIPENLSTARLCHHPSYSARSHKCLKKYQIMRK